MGVMTNGFLMRLEMCTGLKMVSTEWCIRGKLYKMIYTAEEFMALFDDAPEEQPKAKFNMQEFCKKL